MKKKIIVSAAIAGSLLISAFAALFSTGAFNGISNVNNGRNNDNRNRIAPTTMYPVLTEGTYDDSGTFQIFDQESYAAFVALQNAGKKFENKTIYVTADIDMKGYTENYKTYDDDNNSYPIVPSVNAEFYGTFDGLGHTFKNVGMNNDGVVGPQLTPLTTNYTETELLNRLDDETNYPSWIGYPSGLITQTNFGIVENFKLDENSYFYNDSRSSLAPVFYNFGNVSATIRNVVSHAKIWNNSPYTVSVDRTAAPLIGYFGGFVDSCETYSFVKCGKLATGEGNGYSGYGGGTRDYAAIAVGCARSNSASGKVYNSIFKNKVRGALLDIFVRDPAYAPGFELVNTYVLIDDDCSALSTAEAAPIITVDSAPLRKGPDVMWTYSLSSFSYVRADTYEPFVYNIVNKSKTDFRSPYLIEGSNYIYSTKSFEKNETDSMVTNGVTINQSLINTLNSNIDAMPVHSGIALKKVKLSGSDSIAFVQKEGPDIYDASWTGTISKNGSVNVKIGATADAGLHAQAYSMDGNNWQESNAFVISEPGEYVFYVRDANNITTSTTLYINRDYIYTDDDFEPNTDENSNIVSYNIKLTNSHKSLIDEKFAIPNTYKDKPVVALAEECFSNCTKLKNVTMPNNIITIGNKAFYGCTKLSSIIIPNNVSEIGTLAFGNTTSLLSFKVNSANAKYYAANDDLYYKDKDENDSDTFHLLCYASGKTSSIANIQSGTTHVDQYAFYFSNNVTKIVVPNSVSKIYNRAFYYLKNLASFEVISGNNTPYYTIDGNLCKQETYDGYDSKGDRSAESQFIAKRLVQYCPAKTATDYTTPAGINVIDSYAFAYAQNLVSLKLNNGVVSLGSNVISACTNLKSVYFPEDFSVTYDPNLANNTTAAGSLRQNDFIVYHGNSLNQHIFKYANDGNDGNYYGLGNYSEAKWSGSALSNYNELGFKSNNDYVTFYVYGFNTYRFLTTKVDAGNGQYYYAERLGAQSLNQVAVLTTDGLANDPVYQDASDSEKADLATKETTYQLSADQSYYILKHVGSSTEGFFNVPVTYKGKPVKEIADNAFSGLTNLNSVNIPYGVTKIGANAFKGTNLKNVAIPETVISIGNNAFINADGSLNTRAILNISSTDYYYELLNSGSSNLGLSSNDQLRDVSGVYVEVYDPNGKLIGYELNSVSKTKTGTVTVDATYNDLPVISVGNYAFKDCKNVTSVVLPSSIESIGNYAFEGCTALASINLQDTKVNTIGEYAFRDCTSLTSVQLPSVLYTLKNGAFFNCSKLETINIGDTLILALNEYVFADCSKLDNITISSRVTEIGEYAFRNCTSLSSLVIPENVQNIGFSCLFGASSIEEITIPYIGRTPLSTKDAFSVIFGGDSYLDNPIVVPDSLKTVNITAINYAVDVNEFAFHGCESIETVIIDNASQIKSIGQYAFYDCTSLSTIQLNEACNAISDKAFGNCTSLTKIDLFNIFTVGDSILTGCNSLETLITPFLGEASNSGKPLGYFFGITSYSGSYASNQHINNTTSTTYYIPNSLKTVKVNEYGNYDNLAKTTVTTGAFENTNVTKIVISPYVKFIDSYAFSGSTMLVGGSKNIPQIYTNLYSGEELIYNKEGVYNANNPNLQLNFDILGSLESIGAYSFYGIGGQTQKLVLPNSLKEIGEGAFGGWSNLASITLPFVGESYNSNLYAPGNGFGTNQITKENILEGGTNYRYNLNFAFIFGTRNFDNAVSVYTLSGGGNKAYLPSLLRSVEITGSSIAGNTSSNLHDVAFYKCSTLDEQIVIDSAVTTVGKYALYETGLTTLLGTNLASQDGNSNILIRNTITSIGDYAFGFDCDNTRLLVNKTVTSIGKGAFYNWNDLVYLELPFVGKNANTGALSEVEQRLSWIFYNNCGSNVSIPQAGIGSKNYANATYYPKTLTLAESRVVIDGGSIIWNSFNGAETSVSNIELKTGVTFVNNSQFDGCINLKSIILPPDLASIPNYAFRNCTSLTEINIPNKVREIGKSAFAYSTNLVNLIFQAEPIITSIGNSAFKEVPLNGTTIGDEKVFTLPSSLLNIGDYAFNCDIYGNPNATQLVLPTSLLSVGKSSFGGWYNLNKVTLPFLGETLSSNLIYSDELEIHDNSTDGYVTLSYLFGNNLVGLDNNTYSTPLYDSSKYYVVSPMVYTSRKGNNDVYAPVALKEVVILDGVIDYGAFANFNTITTVTIPSSTKYIGAKSFANCTSLTTVNNTGNVTIICSDAFNGATSYTSLTNSFPKVQTIGANAFANITAPIDFTNNIVLREINSGAFSNNASNQTSLTIPNTILSIGDNSFDSLANVETLYTPLDNIVVSKIFNTSINRDLSATHVLVKWPSVYKSGGSSTVSNTSISWVPTSLRRVVVTSGTNICKDALRGLSIDTLEIGATVRTISSNSIANTAIVKLEIPDTVTTIEEGALAFNQYLEDLTVPFVGRSASENNVYSSSVTGAKVSDTDKFGYIFGWGRASGTNCAGEQYYLVDGVRTIYSGDNGVRQYSIPNTLKYVTVKNSSTINLAPSAFDIAGHSFTTISLNNIGTIGQYALYCTSDTIVFNNPATKESEQDLGRVNTLIINYEYQDTPLNKAFLSNISKTTRINTSNYPSNYITIDNASGDYLLTTTSKVQKLLVLKYSYEFEEGVDLDLSKVEPYLYDYRKDYYYDVNDARYPLTKTEFINKSNNAKVSNGVANKVKLSVSSSTEGIPSISRLETNIKFNTSILTIDIGSATNIEIQQRIATGFTYSNYDGKFASPREVANNLAYDVVVAETSTTVDEPITASKDGLRIENISLSKYKSQEQYVLDTDYTLSANRDTDLTVRLLSFTASVTGYEGVYDGATHSLTINFGDDFDPADFSYNYRIVTNYDTEHPETKSTKPEFVNVGVYAIELTISRTNYETQVFNENVIIHKKRVTVTIDPDQGKVYQDPDPVITYTATYDDGGAVGNAVLVGKITRESGESAMTFYNYVTSTLNLINTKNYELRFADNYSSPDCANKFKIAQANLSGKIIEDGGEPFNNIRIETADSNYYYTGEEIKPTVIVKFYSLDSHSWLTLNEGDTNKDYILTYTSNVNVGTATITIRASSNGNFFGNNSTTFEIQKRDITHVPGGVTYTIPTITLQNENVTYTGSEVGVNITEVRVTYRDSNTSEEETLVLGQGDFTYEYANNINVGDQACVIITGTGNYIGTATKYFNIVSRALDDSDDFTYGAIDNQYYTSKKLTPVPTISYNSIYLEEGVDFTCEYTNNINVGTATITLTGKGSYSGSVEKTFQIVPPKYSMVSFSAQKEVPYNGQVSSVRIETFTVSGNDIKDNVNDYDIVYTTEDRINLGYIRFTVVGKNNLSGYTYNGYYKVVNGSIEQAVIDMPTTSYTYTGNEIVPSYSVSFNNNPLTLGTDYYAVITNNIDAGTATLTIYGLGDFENESASKSIDFTITTQEIDENNLTYVSEVVYSGSLPELGVKLTNSNGEVMNIGSDYTLTYSGINVGQYQLTIQGINNYSGSFNKDYTVSKYEITTADKITANTLPYTGNYVTPNVTITDKNGNTLVENTDYTVEYMYGSDGIAVGSQYVTIKGIGNYTGLVKNVSFEITTDTIDESAVSINQRSFIYTGSEIKPIISVVVDGKTLLENVDYYLVYSNNVNVGTGRVEVIFITYAGSVVEEFVINPYQLTSDDLSGVTTSYPYTGQLPAFVYNLTDANGNKLVEDTDYTLTSGGYSVGNHTLTFTGKGNYTGNIQQTYEITRIGSEENPAELNVTVESTTLPYTATAQRPNITSITYGNIAYSLESVAHYIYDDSELTNLIYGYNQIEGGNYGSYPQNVGTYYYVIIVSNDSIFGKAVFEFRITPKDISTFDDSYLELSQTSYVYNGYEHTPTIVINGSDSFASTLSTGYDLNYFYNIEAGEATAIMTGKNNYTGEVSFVFNIVPFDVSDSTLSLSESSHIYTKANSSTYLPSITVDNGGEHSWSTLSYPYYSDLFNVMIRDSHNNEYAVSDFGGDYGTYSIVVYGISPNGTGSKSIQYDITKATISQENVKGTYSGSYEYTGHDQTFNDLEIIFEGSTLDRGSDYTISYTDAVTVGTNRTLRVDCLGNYTGSFELTFEIYTKEVPSSSPLLELVIDDQEFSYTGSPVAPSFEIRYNNATLNDGYTIEYFSDANYNNSIGTTAPKNAGSYYFIVTTDGTSISPVQLKYYYSITPANLTDSRVSVVVSPRSFVYTNTFPAFETLIIIDAYGNELTTDDYDLVIDNYEIENNKMLTIVGKGNYKNYTYAQFDIIGLDLSNDDGSDNGGVPHVALVKYTDDSYNYEYSPSSTNNNAPTISLDGVKLPYPYNSELYNVTIMKLVGENYVEVPSNTRLDIGTYKLVVAGDGANISNSKELPFTIIKRHLTNDNVTTFTGEYEFTNHQMTFDEIEVTVDGVVLTRGVDYSVTTNEEFLVGNNKTVRITGIGDYYDTELEFIYNIVKATAFDASRVDVQLVDKTYTYNQNSQALEFVVLIDGEEFNEPSTVEYYTTPTGSIIVPTIPKNAGTYYVEITIGGTNFQNITLSTRKAYTINRYQASVTLLDQEAIYSGSEPAVDQSKYTITSDPSNFFSNESPLIIISKEEGVDVKEGGYVLSAINENTNFEITYTNAIFTINKKTIEGITFEGDSVTYDGQVHSIAITGELPAGVNATYINNDQTNAGTYTVTVKFTDTTNNYIVPSDKQATLIINKAVYDMSGITFSDASFTYDGSEKSLAIVGNLPEGVSVHYENNSLTNVGSAIVTASFSGDTDNYELIESKQATLTITKATISGISFDDVVVTYDGQVHSIAITGELPEQVSVSYLNNENVNVGVYSVTAVYTCESGNYDISNLDTEASLTINKAIIDMSGISFDNATFFYNSKEHTLEITGSLPEQVSVTYTNNKITEVGEQVAKATFNIKEEYISNYIFEGEQTSIELSANLVCILPEAITIKEEAEAEFINCVKSGKKYIYQGSKTHELYDGNNPAILYITTASLKISEVLDMLNIDTSMIKVYNSKNSLVAASKYNNTKNLIGTGYKLQLVAGDVVLDEVIVCLLGDYNGDGKVATADLNKLYADLKDNSTGSLSKEITYAMDINRDGSVKTADLNKLYAQLKG